MNTLKSIMSEAERAERNQLEAVVTNGIYSFKEVGEALLTIAEKRLYRETHGSFEPYCQEKWSMSARHAYRLCEAAKVFKTLPTDQLVTVTAESQARELAKVPVAQRAEVLALAGAKPTAKAIRESAKSISRSESGIGSPTGTVARANNTPNADEAVRCETKSSAVLIHNNNASASPASSAGDASFTISGGEIRHDAGATAVFDSSSTQTATAGTISNDDAFRAALGLPKANELADDLATLQRRLQMLAQHILDADLSGDDLLNLSVEFHEMGKRLNRIGKSRCVQEVC